MNDKMIRDWARDAGLPVGRRGRIPAPVLEAYMTVHPDAQWEAPKEPEHRPRASCRCGRQWAGLAQAHCPTCHCHFSTASNFDKHRTTGRCLPPGALLGSSELKPVEGPYGITWVGAEERPADLNSGESK
jgi:hypothetical protein